MSFQFHPLTDQLAVAGQLRSEDMAAVARAGFKSVIINRPDFEAGPQQPTSEQVMQAARDAGLTVVYQPVVSGQLTLEDAETFEKHLSSLPRPILAYCRSGGRCTSLFHAAQALRQNN